MLGDATLPSSSLWRALPSHQPALTALHLLRVPSDLQARGSLREGSAAGGTRGAHPPAGGGFGDAQPVHGMGGLRRSWTESGRLLDSRDAGSVAGIGSLGPADGGLSPSGLPLHCSSDEDEDEEGSDRAGDSGSDGSLASSAEDGVDGDEPAVSIPPTERGALGATLAGMAAWDDGDEPEPEPLPATQMLLPLRARSQATRLANALRRRATQEGGGKRGQARTGADSDRPWAGPNGAGGDAPGARMPPPGGAATAATAGLQSGAAGGGGAAPDRAKGPHDAPPRPGGAGAVAHAHSPADMDGATMGAQAAKRRGKAAHRDALRTETEATAERPPLPQPALQPVGRNFESPPQSRDSREVAGSGGSVSGRPLPPVMALTLHPRCDHPQSIAVVCAPAIGPS